MAGEIAFPLKLDDEYPCRGEDANGREFHFDDLLAVGQIVGARMVGDDVFGPWGRVSRKSDGLWIEAAPDHMTDAEKQLAANTGDQDEGGER